MNILFKYPSRSRPDSFFKGLDSVVGNISEINGYHISCTLDTDDALMNNPDVLERLSNYINISIEWGQSSSKIDAINRSVPEYGNIIVLMSDDMVFTKKGFDDVIRKNYRASSLMHFPESYKGAACCVLPIMCRTFYQSFGYIYNPEYNSLWSDVEQSEIAKLTDRYRYVDERIFEHQHYSTGYPMDDLYKRNNTYKKDRIVYWARRADNFGLGEADPFLLIKYATRGRWRQFFAAIDNIYATIRTNQFKIVVSADTDDVEMNCNEVREFCKRYHNVELHYGNHASKVAAINDDFNPLTRWKWCVNMSDDMTFVTPGWDYKMLDDIKFNLEFLGEEMHYDWFGHWNDGFVGSKLPTLNVCGRDYFNRQMYIYHPAYKSVSCDAEEMFKAKMLGKYHYFDEVYFQHRHPANMREPSDYVYRRNHEFGENDTKVFFQRLKLKFGIQNPVMIPDEMVPYM